MTDLFNIMPKGGTSFFHFDSLQMGWFQPSVYIVTTLLKEMWMHKYILRTDRGSSFHDKNDLVRSLGLQSHSGQPKADTDSSFSQPLREDHHSNERVSAIRNCFPFLLPLDFLFPASQVCGFSPVGWFCIIQHFLAAAALALRTAGLAQSQGWP